MSEKTREVWGVSIWVSAATVQVKPDWKRASAPLRNLVEAGLTPSSNRKGVKMWNFSKAFYHSSLNPLSRN